MKDENYDVIFSFEKNNWWYRSKRNIFYLILKSIKRNFGNSLDIGCGVGSNFEVLKKFSKNVIGIDNSSKALSYCKNKDYDGLYNRDAANTKFPDNFFDLVICSDVLEHIDDKKAIIEISRILKPNGTFIFSVPAHNYLWGPTDNISNHLRRYEKEGIKKLLKKDFEIIKLSYWNFFMFFPDLLFIKLISFLNKSSEQKNALQLIPNSINNLLYFFLLIENKLFINYNIPQGVSIVGIAKKKLASNNIIKQNIFK